MDMPSDANVDQSDVKQGYYRARSGQQKKLTGFRRARRYIPYDPLNFAPLPGGCTGHPFGDEIIIKCDVYADEATCRLCGGSGHGEATCGDCGGTKVHYVDVNGSRDKRAGIDRSTLHAVECPSCRASSYNIAIPRSTGKVPCGACRATGQRTGPSGIAIATSHVSEPTTGIVMATGPDARRVKRGMRVMYGRFAGQEYEADDRKWRIMKESYPMMEVKGMGEVRVKEASAILA